LWDLPGSRKSASKAKPLLRSEKGPNEAQLRSPPLQQRKKPRNACGARQREGAALADLKAERAALVAKGRHIETDAAPLRYVAELFRTDTDSDSKTAIRWLIAPMVLCCDPLAIALTAAASARRESVS
jgi:hypothetical protein